MSNLKRGTIPRVTEINPNHLQNSQINDVQPFGDTVNGY